MNRTETCLYLHFCILAAVLPSEQGFVVRRDYADARHSGADVTEAIDAALHEHCICSATDDEPEVPGSKLIDVPEHCAAQLKALVDALDEHDRLASEVAAAERAAGWDASP